MAELAGGRSLEIATRWTKILGAYFSAQGLAQLLSQLAGLLFVNFLPVGEFALYTLAASFIGFFTFATDLGATSALIHFYHQAKKGDGDFAAAHEAVLGLRRLAFLLGSVGVAIAFPLAASRSHFSLPAALPCLAAVLASCGFQIVSSMRLLTLRLDGQYGAAYRAEIAGNAVRFLLAAAILLASVRLAWAALFSGVLALATTSFLSRGAALPERATPADSRAGRRRVLRYLLPTLPSALYYSLQAPLTVWLATAFGSTRSIAEVGALGRLGLLLGFVSNLTGMLFLPRLAAITDERLYQRRYWQFGAFLAVVASGLFVVAAVAPALLLLLLGKHYAGLHGELLLTVAGASVSLLGGYAVAVTTARSWTRWQPAALGVQIAAQILLLAVLPLDTTAGLLTVHLLTATVGLLLQLGINLAGFTRPAWVLWR